MFIMYTIYTIEYRVHVYIVYLDVRFSTSKKCTSNSIYGMLTAIDRNKKEQHNKTNSIQTHQTE